MFLFVCFLAKIGQAGIISCLALNPTSPTIYAAGSFNRSGLILIHFHVVWPAGIVVGAL